MILHTRPSLRVRGRRPVLGALLAGGRGFTLVEIMVIIAIIGTLAAFAVPAYTNAVNAARIARSIGDIRTLEKDITTYEAANGVLPTTLADINRGGISDPWGRGYDYLVFSGNIGSARKDKFLVPLNSTYDLYSRGKDGDSKLPLTAKASWDDIIRASDGGYVGLALNY